ncbi:hypothetical protein A9975_12895 [Cupriavidus sp. UME77]|nr:hypothetical protein [Cupriavidus sp. UME77]
MPTPVAVELPANVSALLVLVGFDASVSVAYSPTLPSQFTPMEKDADTSDTAPTDCRLWDIKVGKATALVAPDVTLHPRVVTLIGPET